MVLLLSAGVFQASAQETGEYSEGLRIPIDQHPNGTIKTQVTAARAMIRPGGQLIDGESVVIEVFDDKGVLQQVARLEKCVFDRGKKEASSAGPVRLEDQGVVVSGTGIEWRGSDESFKILSNAKVEVNTALLDADLLRRSRE